jgi:hypothetical protein
MAFNTTKRHLIELFNLYWNSFLTVEPFAEYRAYRIINIGRKLHDRRADQLKAASYQTLSPF